MGKSNIQWTNYTWNPTTGCTRVSPGCDHCYAFQLHDQRFVAKRAGKNVSGAQYDQPFSVVQLLADRILEPLSWRASLKVFVDSMSDLFHEDVPDEYIAAVFAVMALTPRHTYQILTKRPQRAAEWFAMMARGDIVQPEVRGCALALARLLHEDAVKVPGFRALVNGELPDAGTVTWPLPNVHIGVTVEDQARADERLPILIKLPAAVKFVSAEPLLEQVDLSVWLTSGYTSPPFDDRVSWVIVGGESGHGARPFNLGWAYDLKQQCQTYEAAFFMKQLGARPAFPLAWGSEHWLEMGEPLGWKFHDAEGTTFQRERDGTRAGLYIGLQHTHGSEMSEWPEELRIRQYPT